MAVGLLFAAGVAVSLAASWLLVSRLERLGERAGVNNLTHHDGVVTRIVQGDRPAVQPGE